MRIGTLMAVGVLALGAASAAPAEAREGRREAARNGAPAAQQVRPQRGQASYYAGRFHGRQMANGERFHRNSNSAASRTLPLGTTARVRNLENGRTAEVVVRDRGPYARNRVLDVSPRTAEHLGMREDGTAPVEITPLRVPRGGPG